jgi:hypothetical protein
MMSSDNVFREKRRVQYLPSGPAPSVRIRAALVLICASLTDDGRSCCAFSRYEHDDPEGAIALARSDGWMFWGRVARCRSCGTRGASFGKPGDWK